MPSPPASPLPLPALSPDRAGSRASATRSRKPPRAAFGPNIVAAGLCAIVTLAYAGSFGQLVFDGALSPFVGYGILSALISSVTVLVAFSWRSSFPFSVGGPDSNPSAVLAVTLTAIAAEIIEAGGPKSPELLPTILMYVFVSAIGCGLVVRLLGERGGGRYVRYLPHPVIGGFLAGTGYLLLAGSFRSLTGRSLSLETLPAVLTVSPFAGLTALGVAIALVILSRTLRHYAVIPGVIVVAVIAFHGIRALLGIDLAAAQTAGLLLPRLQLGGWESVGSLPFGDVRWDLILFHAKDFAAMTIVVIVATLLNTTSIELASGRDADADRELRAIGMSNVLAGIFGGMVASNSFNRSMLNLRAGATSPWAARMAAGLIVVVMVAVPGAVSLLPRPVLTGLILFLGVNLMITWVVESRRTLTRMDYLVVLAILGIVIVLGIVAGVVAGIFIACVTLAVTLSRSPNVRHAFTAENRRANVERGPEQLELLRTHGAAMRGYSLQGVLFFGTATRLLEEIRRGLSNTAIVLLDFRLVQGADGSSIVMFRRLQVVCREAGVRIVLTGLNSRLASLLTRGGFELGAAHVRRFADLDRGLEWCEEFILGQTDTPRTLTDVLDTALTKVGSRLLLEFGEHRSVPAGGLVVRQGDPSNEVYFVESGRVQVLMRLGAGADDSKRLRTFGPGSIVGEMGFFSGEPRSADIVAEKDAVVLCLTRERLAAIDAAHPALARAIQRHVIATLAQRLRSANDEIRELL
ncbi:SulP family inorganic anion transporter [Horticoccus sp. 23ND18S-11]|uniref:SulP family inorganic anion transporter n=1 Tax=Horticoccus sp. 23ND18S-11 TaxID=3391832 RepID=UPI0039C93D5C